MSVSALGSSLNSGVLGTAGVADKSLGKDQFLKLLATQLRYQNPLDPLKDSEFVAQLSQFSTLEGIQQLNSNFADMLLLQQMTQGANLIGKTVTYSRPDSQLPGRGVVAAVTMNQGVLQLQIDGKPVTLGQVRSIEPASGGK